MSLPHYPSLKDVPEHLTTRAGLRKQGLDTFRPEPCATVESYGKAIFLYDVRQLRSPAVREASTAHQALQATVSPPKPRIRAGRK